MAPHLRAFLRYYGTTLTFVLTPLILLPIPIAIPGLEGRAAYLLLLMAVFWCGEVIPLGVTGLLPLVLVPLFGIMSTKAVCYSYYESISFMLLGGMFVAIAVEKSNLHRRIATKVLLIIGTSPKWLMLGFMVPTWFLSMWISNTATTAMMMPIVQELLNKLREIDDSIRRRGSSHVAVSDQSNIELGTLRSSSGSHKPETIRENDTNMRFPALERLGTMDRCFESAVENIYSPVFFTNGRGHTISNSACDGVSVLSVVALPSTPPVEGITIFDPPSLEIDPSDISLDDKLAQVNGGYQHEHDVPVTKDNNYTDTVVTKETDIQDAEKENRKFAMMEKALILSVAYAASAGGTGTIIGSSPNLVTKGQADQLWRDHGFPESPLNFATWMVMGLPLSVINLFVIWLWLEMYFVGPRELFRLKKTESDKFHQKAIDEEIQKEYKKLGALKCDEIQVLVLFIILVVAWFVRSPGFIPGWNTLFKDGFTSDAIPVIAVCIIMFALPVSYPIFKIERKPEFLLDWKTIKERFSWDVLLLVGGGFALADTTIESGLSAWIGEQMSHLGSLPDTALVIVLGLLVTVMTQITSNVASATLLLPIAASMAENMGKNPLYLMLTIGVAVQYAFMLPVSNPPNAVAFATGKLQVMDMVKTGWVLNVLCVLTMTVVIQTWATTFFSLDAVPWSDIENDVINITTAANVPL